jgi:hypothetical protein
MRSEDNLVTDVLLAVYFVSEFDLEDGVSIFLRNVELLSY